MTYNICADQEFCHMVQPQSPESQYQQNNSLWWITDYSNMDTCKEAVDHRNPRSIELAQFQGGHMRLELKKGQKMYLKNYMMCEELSTTTS